MQMSKTPVTFALKNVPVWSAVHLFARSCGLEASHDGGAFMFKRPLKPDEVWATLKIKVGGGKLEVRILRADVPAELRRGVVRKIIAERVREEEEGDDGEGDGDRPRKKPAPGKGGKRRPVRKDELF